MPATDLASWARRAYYHPALLPWRHRARRLRDEWVDEQLRQLRAVGRELARRDVDVLFFGDSSYLFVSQTDVDKRRLARMIADELPERSVTGVQGAGYGPRMYAAFTRLLRTAPHRPRVVLLTMCVRSSTATHLVTNPHFSYARSLARLDRLVRARVPLRALVADNRVRPDEYDAHNATPLVTRWGGPATVGDFRARLRGASQARDEATERVMFDFFHGEVLDPSSPGVSDWAALGRELRSWGVPVVAYRTPVPLLRGEHHFPGEFAEHVEANYRLIESVFAAELGPLLTLVPNAEPLPYDDFVDHTDGSEHLAEGGRQKLAKQVAAEVRAVLDPGLDSGPDSGPDSGLSPPGRP